MRRLLLLGIMLAMLVLGTTLPLVDAVPFLVSLALLGGVVFFFGQAMARLLVARFRPASRLFATVARLSLNGQTSDPVALRQNPRFRVATWPTLGLMPEAVVRNPVRRAFLTSVRTLFSTAMELPRIEDRCHEPTAVHQLAVRYFGTTLLPSIPSPRPGDLSAERLYEQVSVAGFYHLRPNRDATHSLDLQFLRDYTVRDGAFRCGGEAVVDLHAGKLLHLVTPEDRVVTPEDPRFALEAMRFRSSLFQWLTIAPHSAWAHGVVGPKLFLATYALPEKHPLRELLRPFVFKVHENATRAKVTVFGKAGVLTNTGSLAPISVQALIARGAYGTEVKMPAQMHMPAYLRTLIEPLWDAKIALATGFMNEFSVSDDVHVRAWRSFVAANIHPSFRELSLPETVAFCLFTNSVAHHLWGHLYYGSTDPRYVSGMTRAVDVTDEASLMKAAEPRDISILRLGVIVSTRRQVVNLSSNLAVAADDHRIKRLFDEFSQRVRTVEKAAPPTLELHRLATSGMV